MPITRREFMSPAFDPYDELHVERQYLDVMERILSSGHEQEDRTGTGTIEIWAPTIRIDMKYSRYFPILITKEVRWRKAFAELVWMIQGHTNVQKLHEYGVKYWDDWADQDGELGPVYGHQWRAWGSHDGSPGIDQLSNAIQTIRENPTSRRIIVSAWNVSALGEMRLPPCHLYYQFNVQEKYLNMLVVQRSADWFLGVPFNIIQYTALNDLVARMTGLLPGEIVMQFGSAHLYKNHIEQAESQLGRRARLDSFCAKHGRPVMKWFRNDITLDSLTPADFDMFSYYHMGHIAAPISV